MTAAAAVAGKTMTQQTRSLACDVATAARVTVLVFIYYNILLPVKVFEKRSVSSPSQFNLRERILSVGVRLDMVRWCTIL